jgi:cobalt/nickel transport system permease protein
VSETTATPSWLLEPQVGLCPCGCIGTRRRESYLSKTLRGTATLIHEALSADESAGRNGLLQRIDPRTKLVALIALLLIANLARGFGVLILLEVVAIAAAAASGLSVPRYLRRVWLVVPLFSGLVALPAMLNVVTPGDDLVQLPFGLAITRQGLTTAALLVARVGVSVSLAALVTQTTPWHRLLAALRGIGVPRVFVLVVGMAYRYVHVLLATAEELYIARRARTLRRERDARAGRAFVAAGAGVLFGRAHALAEEVHMAMLSRGFRGGVHTLAARPLGRADALCAVAVAALALAALGVGHVGA